MSFAGKWVEMENIRLIKISQSHKEKVSLFPLISGIWQGEGKEHENKELLEV
jgi:hypothetical protein